MSWYTFYAALLCSAQTIAVADEPAPSTTSSAVTSFPSDYFARTRTYSAYDMLALLPGYTFIESDTQIRGYSGAAGNVLIDGHRPASKYESLESILRRIPAAAVDRIELIRAGAPGIDMQGYAVLANVIRLRGVQMRGSVEAGNEFYERDLNAPRLSGELARRSGDSLIELSSSLHQAIEDENGAGRRWRVSPQGELLRDGSYAQDDIEKVAAVAAGYENAAFDGKLRLHGAVQQSRLTADILELLTVPVGLRTDGAEYSRETNSEVGMLFERTLSGTSAVEVLAIRRDTGARSGERYLSDDESSSFRDRTGTSESILRTLVRRQSGARTLEGGIELALNTLDSRSSLVENNVVAAIPNSDVAVDERRGEAFVTGKWNLRTVWHLELGARLEYSELTHRGDDTLSKSFFFPKPRAALTWSPGNNRIRFIVEREVGQLEFEDFASSASLSTGVVTAGNRDLEPDRTWRGELAWERRFFDSGAITIAARHEEIEDLIDRVPVVADTVFDSVGNIGAAVRDELEIDLTLPLDFIGLRAGVLKATALWRSSETKDPITRQSRAISEDEPFEGSLHFLQPLPQWNVRWGFDLNMPDLAREYYFDEVRVIREGAGLDVFVEHDPAPSWNVRFYVNNVTGSQSSLRRNVHDGARSDSELSYIETRKLGIGPSAGVLVRRNFGN